MNEIEVVRGAMNLSSMFTLLRDDQSMNLSVEDFRVTLPCLFLNPKILRSLSTMIYKQQQVSFRLSCMRELFDANLPESPPGNNSFEDCGDADARLFFLMTDLGCVTDKKPTQWISLVQYQQFMGDALVILCARFTKVFSVSTFVSAAFIVGDTAVLSLCFAFPHFIAPAFAFAQSKEAGVDLLTKLVVMSPSHRALLLPELKRFPVAAAMIAIKCFPEDAVAMIPATALAAVYDELMQLEQTTPQYYRCFARCCACKERIPSTGDFAVFKNCKDEVMLAHMMFTIDDAAPKLLSAAMERFMKVPEAMAVILDLICDVRNRRLGDVAAKVAGSLGDDYDWNVRTEFANYVLKNFDLLTIQAEWFGKGAKALALIDSFREDIQFAVITQIVPEVINTTESVDFPSMLCVQHFVQTVSKFHDKSVDFMRYIYQMITQNQSVFELEAIAKNCCPALLYTEMILLAEERFIGRQDPGIRRFMMANQQPIRFVLNCAYHNPECATVFAHMCGRCQTILPHIFCRSALMGDKPGNLISHGDANMFLHNMASRISEINAQSLEEWMQHHFVMSFQYTVDTISALKGPIEFVQLHEAFAFPVEVLRNEFALRIALVCMVEIVAMFEELFQALRVESKTNKNTSLYIVVAKAIDLLKDPLVSVPAVCQFINNLFFVTCDAHWLLETILICGVEESIIETLANGVGVLSTSWRSIEMVYMQSTSTKVSVFLLQFASHLAAASPNPAARDFFRKVLAKSPQTLLAFEAIDRVLGSVVRMCRVFPDLSVDADSLLETMKRLVQSTQGPCDVITLIDAAIERVSGHALSNIDEDLQT